MRRSFSLEQRPTVVRSWCLAGLLLGSASAQRLPAPTLPNPAPPDVVSPLSSDAALCAGASELLDVTISGLYRGVREARRSSAGLLLEQAALSASESGYEARAVACDGTVFALLRPELQVAYDAQALSLKVLSQPVLLTSNTLDIAEFSQRSGVSASPVYGVAYAATADLTFADGQTNRWGSDQAALDIFGAQGRWSAYAGALGRWDGSKFSVQPRAQISAELRAGWQVSASAYTSPFSAAGALSGREFWGVGVRGSNLAAQLDRLPVSLPLDAQVSVLIDGVTITTVSAQAGELLLKNLPVLAGGSQVTVVVTDATGRRILDQTTPSAYAALPPHGYDVQAEAGLESGQPYGAAALSYGLNDHWQLLGDGKWQAGRGSGSLQAAYVGEARQFSLGAAYDAAGLSVLGSYGQTFERMTLGLNARVPISRPDLLSVGLNANLALPRGSVYLLAGYQPSSDLGPWSLGAGGYYRLNDEVIVGGFVQAQQGRQLAGLNLRWQLRPNLSLSAQASGGHVAPDTLQDKSASPWTGGGRLGIEYAPSAGRRLGVSVAFPAWQDSQLLYEDQRNVAAQLVLTPRRLHAGIAGVVNVIGGQLVTGRETSARSLLVRTGVAGVQLLVGGQPAVTDQRGNALVALDPAAQQVSVSVYSDGLPVNVTVRNDSARLNVRGNGLITLDWRSNFEVSRWVRLFWISGEPAANADLHLGGQSLPADPDGNVLLPQNLSSLSGVLSSQDGTRQCAITLTAAPSASCGGPP